MMPKLASIPFHIGENAVQRLAQVPQSDTSWVMNQLTPQHERFFAELPYIFLGVLDRVNFTINIIAM